ncbi:type VI secretion system lipoprotein TssJ [Rhodovulum euryhalinum]|uniref:Type VI secretion system protein VasD n=1 Tax=Rhodovulum euryhalinum TaxID=35805 RepID=A0A4R2KEB5_9RHOB|nr:type VI secretion system lipoprotein TssJ [Rhodovulum euryhalinum]TCO70527.1 type VI secretion system protein VasD [Rhodovulum euryhalinum]
MTQIDRRVMLAGTGAVLLLAGCNPGPGALTVSAQGAAGMNPGPDGADRPLTLTILQLRGSAAFDGADFYALQNPQGALGGDLVKADQIVLTPGASASKVIGLETGTAVIGVVAGYRDPGGKVFRAKTGAPAKGNAGIIVKVGPGGISLTSA